MSLVCIASRIIYSNQITRIIGYHLLKFSSGNVCKVENKCILFGRRFVSYSNYLNKENQNDPKTSSMVPDNKPKKKKKEKLVYITLIENDNISVMTHEDAMKLSKRRNLKLVQIKDYETKTERATYQLMSPAELMAEEKSSKKDKKDSTDVKLLSITSKIEEHDLVSKTKNIIKWLNKKNEVRISISNDDNKGEDVFKRIADTIEGSGRIVQKRLSNNALKFHILPMKQSEVRVENDKSS
ncbi:translation initiation factor IF-3, chloroplastic isoform X1 [Nilaparvata lugens]|uniref:translation initiation factor IF-3, chloroplastic isoform X1 n=1 Tax=Nilaparvata lugens TaxID=108931 RepID=UPI00193D9B3C|nr:translation initiation factor IF-3, chloroplastic isoform X1 [Nilaparvata lugens]